MSVVANWLVRLIPGARSMQAVIDHVNRAEQLRAQGRLEDALTLALQGLSLRRLPPSPASSAADLTALLSLTVLAEEVGTAIGRPGANERDVIDSVNRLRSWNDAVGRFPDLGKGEPVSVRETRDAWLAYLEQRLEARRRTIR